MTRYAVRSKNSFHFQTNKNDESRRPDSSNSSVGSSKIRTDNITHRPSVEMLKERLANPPALPAKKNVLTIPQDNRRKSFIEARLAVQKHIEKMMESPIEKGVTHASQGVSHALPEDYETVEPPPPTHYGIKSVVGSKLRTASSVNDIRLETKPLKKTLNNLSKSDHELSRCSTLSSSKSKTSSKSGSSGITKHKVDYLGAKTIPKSSTNLVALQGPLKDLYFKYKAMRNLGQSNLPGTLQIDDNGMTVQYIRELHKGVQEIFNPFSTIAVWAAVKFVRKQEISSTGSIRNYFAFLPLISDPDDQDKRRLFSLLNSGSELDLATDSPHPPLFACVMRRNGSPKVLECHGFVCPDSEDAIVIAANLYQALLQTMTKKTENEPVKTSSSIRPSRPPPPPPVRKTPPSRPLPSKSPHLKVKKNSSFKRSSGKFRRKQWKNTSGGDVYTRVAIPRSKSFMNVSGTYNLQELFKEIKEKEGIESVDDVLKKVISPNGISFNEIKPVYRELLLKLAVTMTQDEIFERSRSILSMKKRKESEKSTESSNVGLLGSLFKKKSSTPESPKVKNFLTKADISNPMPLVSKYTTSATQTVPIDPLPPTPIDPPSDCSCSECGDESEYETVTYGCSCSGVDSNYEGSKCYCSLPRTGSTGVTSTTSWSLIASRRKNSIGYGSNDSSSRSCCCSCYSGEESGKILLCSAIDKKGNLFYGGESKPREGLLSMKKSAEIAAVFSGVKISQTTDIMSDNDSTDDAYDSMKNISRNHVCSKRFSSSNIKKTLGYLP